MRALVIDFVRSGPRFARVGWVVLAAGAVSVAFVLARHAGLESRRMAIQTRLEAMASADMRTPAKTTRTTGPRSEDRRRAARLEIAAALERDWDALFADIESATGPDVALLAVEPDARKSELRLSGEAKDASALAGYIARLEATKSLARVNLAQHERVADAGAEVIRFVILGRWAGLSS